ncbi:hypothetical protein CJ030_MR7G011786 [Morella rubra]|uniref:Putative plant transposon protein domain-containing protein n=1 Tax=Morella rubra TaxID=262757 RepID=A0A6A1V0W8_9ROSI|nr:hypothetical protein CJ030_MR7G011786 [Morella rubra]
MVKVKQSPGKKSKPAKVPYKTKPHDFDGTQFVDACASELFHSYFNNHHIIAEREDSFLQELSHLFPPKLLVEEYYLNFFDIDEASLSFSVFIRGQHLRVSPDIIVDLFGFKAMTLLLFEHPYPYAGGTLNMSGSSAENHVVSRIALTNLFPISHLSTILLPHVRFLYALLISDTIDVCSVICSHMIEIFQSTTSTVGLSYACLIQRLFRSQNIAFPPEGPFPQIFYAIGAKTLSLICVHLRCLQASASAFAGPSSVPPTDPSSSIPPRFNPSSFVPSHLVVPSPSTVPSRLLLPSPLDPSFTASFTLILDWIDSLTVGSNNLIKIVIQHQRQLKRHTLTLARNARAISLLHRLIRPPIGANALQLDISSPSESSVATGASAPSSNLPADNPPPTTDPPTASLVLNA